MIKITEWVKENNVSSHGIFAEPELKKSFENETGLKASWRVHSRGGTNSTMGSFKGVETPIRGFDHALCSYGYEVLAWLESTYAKSQEYARYNGRGFAFRASLEALEKKGL